MTSYLAPSPHKSTHPISKRWSVISEIQVDLRLPSHCPWDEPGQSTTTSSPLTLPLLAALQPAGHSLSLPTCSSFCLGRFFFPFIPTCASDHCYTVASLRGLTEGRGWHCSGPFFFLALTVSSISCKIIGLIFQTHLQTLRKMWLFAHNCNLYYLQWEFKVFHQYLLNE